jgi:hypothetical protein
MNFKSGDKVKVLRDVFRKDIKGNDILYVKEGEEGVVDEIFHSKELAIIKFNGNIRTLKITSIEKS